MRVILDTNIYLQDVPMEGPTFVTFLDGLETAGHTLLIPQIVFDELVNKYAEKYERFLESARKLGVHQQGPIPQSAGPNVAEAKCLYADFLRNRLHAGKQIPYPTTPHIQLVNRALARRKPFRNTDTGGYRDALLWETVRNLAFEAPDSPIAFVTANSRDFAGRGQSSELHPDLAQDLRSADRPASEVHLFGRLKHFVDAHITPILQSLGEIRDQLASSTFPHLNLSDFVQEQLQDHVGWMEFQPHQLGFPSEFETSHLSMVSSIEQISEIDVRQLPSGDLLISFRVRANCEFDVFIYKADYYSLPDDHLPYVWDNDWNEWYVGASASSDIEMQISLILDLTDRTIKSASIADIQPRTEWSEMH